jgi:hypothetical protein
VIDEFLNPTGIVGAAQLVIRRAVLAWERLE